MSILSFISSMFSNTPKTTESSLLEKAIQDGIKSRDVSDLPTNPVLLLEHLKSKVNPILENIPQAHWITFIRKRKNLTILDDYGDEDDTMWNTEFKNYFDKQIRPQYTYKDCMAFGRYAAIQGNMDIDDPEFWITLGFVNNVLDCNENLHEENASRPDDPYEYEHYCARILRDNGWTAFATKASGDQGGDIKAVFDGITVIFQCKLYSQPVGNKAVQEVSASLKYYGADYGAVVTNAEFTRSAKTLAKANRILLIHDSNLGNTKISEFTSFDT